MPQTVAQAAVIADSGVKDRIFGDGTGTGRCEWTNGHAHHSGFTVTFGPNTRVPYSFNGVQYNIDYNSRQEGNSTTAASYAILTSRSFHTGLVQAARLDGSVQSFSNGTDLAVWRALGTRAGGETIQLSD
jgi:hypothetical protein